MTGGDGRDWLATLLRRHPSSGLPDTAATAALPRFQRDAAVRLIALLETGTGALLADDVGLGKTFISLAVLRSRPAWRPALVVAPAAVLPAWERELEGEPGVQTATFARLSRRRIRAPPEGYRLVVVDEAHRLRNPATRRYRALTELAEGARVLLVTASPIHNWPRDLVALLDLIVPGAGAERDFDRLRWTLRRATVRRTRWTVSEVYPRETGREHGGLVVPESSRRSCVVLPTCGVAALLPELPSIARALMPEATADEGRELLALLLAKRLESSPAALLATLRRGRNYLLRAQEAARQGERLSRRGFRALFGADPEAQVAQYLLPFFFSGGEPPSVDFTAGLALVDRAMENTRRLVPADDAKLAAAQAALGESGRSVVMTQYEDTARYLVAHLNGERWLLTGRGAWSNRAGRVDRRDVLRAFGPRGLGAEANAVLVATDVLREGVNLQGAARLIHYDLPWSPMALEQRFGRLDRLGARGRTVTELALRLGGPFEPWLQLEGRLARKRSAAARLLSQSATTSVDRVGIDREGLLMACRARLEAGGVGPFVRALCVWPEQGWLIATDGPGDLAFYWVDEEGCRTAPAELLVALASGTVSGGTARFAPNEVAAMALALALDRQRRTRVLALEPQIVEHRLRAGAAALGSRAREAHRRGDLAQLSRYEALGSEWAGGARARPVPFEASSEELANLTAVAIGRGRAERDSEHEVTVVGAMCVNGGGQPSLGRESADVGALGHSNQTTAERQRQG